MTKELPRARPPLNLFRLAASGGKAGQSAYCSSGLSAAARRSLIAYYGVWWIRGESADLPRFEWLLRPPAKESIVKISAKTILPASNPNAVPRGLREAGTQTPFPSASPIEKNEVTANRPAPQIEQTPGDIPASDIGPKQSRCHWRRPNAACRKTGLRPPANFSSLDLEKALDAATDAFVKTGSGKVNAENYPAICRLAEVQTYIAPDKLLPSQQRNMQALLDTIAKDPRQIAEIGRLAGEAVKKAVRRTGRHPGRQGHEN